MSFKYRILAKKANVPVVAKKIKALKKAIERSYEIELGAKIKLGSVTEHPRSVVVEVPDGTSLNVLSVNIASALYGIDAKIPYWG